MTAPVPQTATAERSAAPAEGVSVPFAGVLVMAGSGQRLGAGVPKAFVPLAGRPLWLHAAAALAGTPGCALLVLVVPAGREADVLAEATGLGVPVRAVPGGERRQDSVRCGVAAVPESIPVTAVHDAARPFLSATLAAAVVRAAAESGAALAAIPVRDTLKRVGPPEGAQRDGAEAAPVVRGTVDREGLWQAQTPQAFRTDLLRRAHEAADRQGIEATDDAQLAEALGLAAVRVVRGDPWNFKVTEPGDRQVAETLLRQGPQRGAR